MSSVSTSEVTPSDTSGSAAQEKPHFAVLDGLRGIAILMVLVVHFYRRDLVSQLSPLASAVASRFVAPMNYGVELFFVLSGFLITGILLDTRSRSGFFVKFYARRTLRIFPLYYGALIAIFCITPLFITLDVAGQAISNRQLWLWSYMADWPKHWIWDDSKNFLLGHFWSLAVEEHFYLVWPALVWVISYRRLFGLCSLVLLLSALARLIANLYGTDSPAIIAWPSINRIDGLAVGAMIAIAQRDNILRDLIPAARRLERWLLGSAATAAILLLLPQRLLKSPTVEAFSETAMVVFFGLLLIHSLNSSGQLRTLLTSRFLVTFGKYSYGIYVIHGILRPVFHLKFNFNAAPMYYGLPILWVFLYYLITIGISFILAYASFHLYEKHFLNLKRFFEYNTYKKPCA